MSLFSSIGFGYTKASLEAVSGNLRILPLETALKGDLNEMSNKSEVENFLQRRCKRPPLARLSLERSGAGDRQRRRRRDRFPADFTTLH